MVKNKCYYEVSYFDPADPKGEEWRTWKSKSKKKLKKIQEDLKVAWKSPAKEFPIRKDCLKRRK